MLVEKFEVVLSSQPKKYYLKCSGKIASLLNKSFEEISCNPFHNPKRIKKLKGKKGLSFRYRRGTLRITYEVKLPKREVAVYLIKPRGDVYK